MSNTYPQVRSGKQDLGLVPNCPAEFKFRAACVSLSGLQPNCPSAKAFAGARSGSWCALSGAAALGLNLWLCLFSVEPEPSCQLLLGLLMAPKATSSSCSLRSSLPIHPVLCFQKRSTSVEIPSVIYLSGRGNKLDWSPDCG